MALVSLLIWQVRGFMQGNTSLTDESPVTRALDLSRPAVVGRKEAADLSLEDGQRTLAREHARLSLRDFGVAWEDLGSSNGVRLIDVDGRELKRAANGVAAPGTRLRLGSFVIGIDHVPKPPIPEDVRLMLREARGRPAHLAVYADQLESRGELDVALWLRTHSNGSRGSLWRATGQTCQTSTILRADAHVAGSCALRDR